MPVAAAMLDVADWRQRVFALYADVRAADDPASGHAIWRAGRDELFATHPSTPLLPDERASFAGLPVSTYDPAWRFEAEIVPPTADEADAAGPRRLEVATGTDGIVAFELLGSVVLANVGSLDVWRLASYGGGLFVPVRDALAGKAGGTYGGGRYLVDTIKGADLGRGVHPSTMVIDLNFAYNPSCAYDPAWACPLAPPGNVLGVDVPVGERYG